MTDNHCGEGLASFSSYQEAIEWLYGTQLFGIKLGLQNIQRLLSTLSLPDRDARIVHVAGTNGKGSVCAFTDSLLRAAGYRVGVFTSPHLIHFGERMRINGTAIPEPEIATRLSKLRELTTGWEQHPTFFELTVTLALDWFRDDGVDIIVLETGMGGRLDATNAVTASASVITPIALDHQKWLGDTLAQIASEKAGIFKADVPAISAPQQKEAAEVLLRKAREIGTTLNFIDENCVNELTDLPLGLEGEHQRLNAALALATVRAIGCEPKEEALRHALSSTRWPARFQRFLDGRIVIDGGHNVQAATAVVATWKAAFGDAKATLIFGSVADKDYRTILRVLAPIAETICYVSFDSQRAISPEKLANECHPDPDIPFQVGETLAATLESLVNSESRRILITGSLFLAGEAIAIMQNDKNFEQSQQ